MSTQRSDDARRQMASRGDLERQLDTWVGLELITREQASRILEIQLDEPQRADHRSAQSGSLVTEALGYVGGVLILIAAAVIAGQYFDDLGRTGRLAVTGVAAATLLGAGLLLRVNPARPATGRLRSVLMVLAVAVVAFFLALLGDETFGWTGEDVAFLSTSGAALVSLELWRRHRWILQQAAVAATLSVAVGVGVAAYLADGEIAPSGLATWGLGGVWLMLGWGRHLRPRYGTDLLGGAVLTIGSEMMLGQDWVPRSRWPRPQGWSFSAYACER